MSIPCEIALRRMPRDTFDIREVLLHVKRERLRVTSDSEAQIRYTSRLRTHLGFATRRDVSADKQAHRYQRMTRQQPIKHIRNKSERTLPNDILAQGQFLLPSVTEMTLRELTGYTWKTQRVTCSLPWTVLHRTQVLMTSNPLVLFYTNMFTCYMYQNLSDKSIWFRWWLGAVR